MENKLKKILEYFISKQFQYAIEEDYEMLFFTKEENDTKKCIQIEYRNLGTDIRLGAGTTAYVEINKVEIILKKITKEEKHYNYTISGVVGVEKSGYMLDDFFYIKNEKDIDDYISKLDVYYQSHIAPFFEAVPTLQSFNDEVLSVVSFDDYYDYLSGEVGLKAMIIMHLCKNPLYDKYILYREEDFKNSPYLHNPESRYHKISKQSYDEFNKFKEMVTKGEI